MPIDPDAIPRGFDFPTRIPPGALPDPSPREFPDDDPGLGRGPPPVVIPPARPVAVPRPVGPAPVAGAILSRAGVFGAIGALSIEILRRLGERILEREEAELRRQERELEELRRQRARRQREQREAIPEPLRRAPTPVFPPARPQRVDLPDVVAPQPLPAPEPTRLPPVSVPQPSPLPAPTIPRPSIPSPAPATVPTTVPGTAPAPSPATLPAPRPRPAVSPPLPGPLPGVIPFPLPLPSPRVAPRPGLRPRIRDLVPEIVRDPLTTVEAVPVPSVSPFPQPAAVRPRECPPCERDLDELRDACFKKLVKEGLTPRLDQEFEWVEIDCITGREL